MGDPAKAASERTQRLVLAGMYVLLVLIVVLAGWSMAVTAYTVFVVASTGLVVFRAVRRSGS